MHWPEYAMEGALLATFMLSACVFASLLEYPDSPVHQALPEAPLARRAIIGLAMGLTALGLITSRWGQRSGAHMNPAVTLTFLTLGKVGRRDAFFYVLFQFFGGASGVLLARAVIGPPLHHSSVRYVATMPGPAGAWVAFAAEFAISMLMMSTVLWSSNSRRFSRYTPVFAAVLVASFITFEAPLSGMSMNPARTFGSALSANVWSAIWVYFTAPVAAMLLASAIYRAIRGARQVFCAKLYHPSHQPCIFQCRYGELNVE
jgi:aquaporin Z